MARIQILTDQEADKLTHQSPDGGLDLTVLMRDGHDNRPSSTESTLKDKIPGKRKAPGLDSSSSQEEQSTFSRSDTCDENGTYMYTTVTKRRLLHPGSTVFPGLTPLPHAKTARGPTALAPRQKEGIIEEGEEEQAGDTQPVKAECTSSQIGQCSDTLASSLRDLARAFERHYGPCGSSSATEPMSERAATLVTS